MEIKPINTMTFPSLPETIYASTPVYLEPIAFSGERIAILIVISSPKLVIHKTIRRETIEAMFGSKAESFLGMVDLCIKSLESHFNKQGTMENWVSPICGCYKGDVFSEHAHSSTDTLRMGARKFSSMGFLPGEADFEEEPVKNKRDRWPDLVEAALSERAPELVKHFGMSFHVTRNARPTTIDYIGEKYVANLGKITPGQNFSNSIKAAKSKLWDVEALRESRKGDIIADRVSAFEILLWRPRFDSPEYTERQIINLKEALEELEFEGDKRELRVKQVLDQKAAANRIIEKEAA